MEVGIKMYVRKREPKSRLGVQRLRKLYSLEKEKKKNVKSNALMSDGHIKRVIKELCFCKCLMSMNDERT